MGEGETHTKPFALQALGVARFNRQLLDPATAFFEAMEMEWHADATLGAGLPALNQEAIFCQRARRPARLGQAASRSSRLS